MKPAKLKNGTELAVADFIEIGDLIEISTPKELGGAGGQATNPEQLFAAGRWKRRDHHGRRLR